MALIACRECGKEVSDTAATCPHCGFALKKPAAKSSGCGTVVAAIILLPIIFVTFFGLFSDRSSSPTPAKSEAEKKKDAAVNRAAVGARLLKKSARNPERFKLESALVMEDGAVCYTFRTENAFGGMTLGRAVLASKTDRFLASDSEGFAALWNSECASKVGDEVATAIRWFAL